MKKSGIQKNKQKLFNPQMRTKKHFALKDTFPMETIVKKNRKISQNFQNVAQLFFKKKTKKKSEKIFVFLSRRLRRICIFFFRRLQRLLCCCFFPIRKWKSVGKIKKSKKKIRWLVWGGGPTWKFFLYWKVTLPL